MVCHSHCCGCGIRTGRRLRGARTCARAPAAGSFKGSERVCGVRTPRSVTLPLPSPPRLFPGAGCVGRGGLCVCGHLAASVSSIREPQPTEALEAHRPARRALATPVYAREDGPEMSKRGGHPPVQLRLSDVTVLGRFALLAMPVLSVKKGPLRSGPAVKAATGHHVKVGSPRDLHVQWGKP